MKTMAQLEYKNLNVLQSLFVKAWHPMLIGLLQWMVLRYNRVLFTQGFEKRDYPSVHNTDPLRGFDIRHSVYEDPVAVVDDINKHWIYDPNRPNMKVAILHDVGRGMHMHMQVCDRTALRH